MNRKFLSDYAARLSRERGRPVRAAEAEAEATSVIMAVCRSLASTYRFGYHSAEDIVQQGVVEALLALEEESYDPARPLENFLYTAVRNGLYNYKRKHYSRLEPACKCCDPANPPPTPCEKMQGWLRRNSTKQNLMKPLAIGFVSDEAEATMRLPDDTSEGAEASELRALLDRELPVELRRDYLQMLDGAPVPKARRQRVREAVLAIMRERGHLDAEEEEDS